MKRTLRTTVLIITLATSNYASAILYTVNTLTDTSSGTGTSGSLRYVMGLLANGDTILFDASLSGSIVLDSGLGELPGITTSNCIIRGNLAAGVPKVAIDGSNLSAADGFDISGTATGLQISNLAFINFSDDAGIFMHSSGSCIIDHCYFGTADGTTAAGNDIGLFVENNTAGVTAKNCVMSGNDTGVCYLNCTTGTLTNNYIGTNAQGTAGLANTENGLILQESTNITVGGSTKAKKNIISGNGADGIQLLDSSSCTIQNNYIGMNVTGLQTIANGAYGIEVTNDNGSLTQAITISNNLISGNTSDGITFMVVNPGSIRTSTISNNYIGINAQGVSIEGIGNGNYGISFRGYTLGTEGTSGDISHCSINNNVISGNFFGNIVFFDNAVNNSITKNIIGLNANGSFGYFTPDRAIKIDASTVPSSRNTIGGINSSDGNIIANNKGNGFYSIGTAASNFNAILSTVMYASESTPAILLEPGANHNQQPPTIQSTNVLNTGSERIILVQGTAPTVGNGANVPLLLQFFITQPRYSAVNPQGQIYLGSITTIASKTFNAQLSTPIASINGYYLTATATAFNNAGTPGDSSEFSAATPLVQSGLIGDSFTQRLIEKYGNIV